MTTRARPPQELRPLAILPTPCRGLSRAEAARYVGISPSKFDQLVAESRMPTPRRLDGRKLWDVRDLDLAFDGLPYENAPATGTSWDDR